MKERINLIKLVCVVVFIVLSIQNIFCKAKLDKTSQEQITISISHPYMRNQSVNTIFFNKQFVFEFLSLYNADVQIEILSSDDSVSETEYKLDCIEGAKLNDSDYLIYSVISGYYNNIFLKVNIINVWTGELLLYKFYSSKVEYGIDEVLTEVVSKIIDSIKELKLTKIAKIVTKNKKEKNLYASSEQTPNYKHEIFIQSGILKNHPTVMSFLNLYLGYNFSPFEIFNIEGALFLGTGYYEKKFNFGYDIFNDFFIGTYAAFRFFLKGKVEPSIGLRGEFSYLVVHKVLSVALPIDVGIKIYINNENLIRINSSFQFNYFDIFIGKWVESWTVGVLVGYARKL